MTHTEHTPGPWQQDWQFIVAPDPDGIHPDISIAEIAEEDSEGRVGSPSQQEANGHLIVAAPELLAACRLVVDRWEHGDLAEAARACQAAVALATGGRPFWGTANPNVSLERPYSVLLLYPDVVNDSGHETYHAFVEAADPLDAIAIAQRLAADAQFDMDLPADEFTPLLVIEGHHASLPLFDR